MKSPFVDINGNPLGVNFTHPDQVQGVSGLTKQVLQRVAEGVKSVVPQLQVMSGYRSPAVNDAVGGAKGSQHMQGNAIDLDLSGLDEAQKQAVVDSVLAQPEVNGFGAYDKNINSIHFDTRTGSRAVWGPDYHSASFSSVAPPWLQQRVNPWLGGASVAKPAATTGASKGFVSGGSKTVLAAEKAAVPPIPDLRPPVDKLGIGNTDVRPRLNPLDNSSRRSPGEINAAFDGVDLGVPEFSKDFQSQVANAYPEMNAASLKPKTATVAQVPKPAPRPPMPKPPTPQARPPMVKPPMGGGSAMAPGAKLGRLFGGM